MARIGPTEADCEFALILTKPKTSVIIEIDSMDNAIYGGEYAHSKPGWYINPDDIKEMEPKGQ